MFFSTRSSCDLKLNYQRLTDQEHPVPSDPTNTKTATPESNLNWLRTVFYTLLILNIIFTGFQLWNVLYVSNSKFETSNESKLVATVYRACDWWNSSSWSDCELRPVARILCSRGWDEGWNSLGFIAPRSRSNPLFFFTNSPTSHHRGSRVHRNSRPCASSKWSNSYWEAMLMHIPLPPATLYCKDSYMLLIIWLMLMLTWK
jgi:hypothetical protein